MATARPLTGSVTLEERQAEDRIIIELNDDQVPPLGSPTRAIMVLLCLEPYTIADFTLPLGQTSARDRVRPRDAPKRGISNTKVNER